MDTVKIIIDTNAEEAAKSFDDLSQSFNKADTAAVDLRKQIKDLKKDLYSLTPGTEEYAQKLQELGSKMNQLGDTQRQLRAASGGLDTVFQTTTKSLSSLAGGFQAAMGVVTLFGGKSEDLQKAFVKLQAVMAITNGLSGFAGFIKYSKDAIASIAAFIAKITLSTAAVNADTAAKVKNTQATLANSAAQKTAAGTTADLGAKMSKTTKEATGLVAVISKIPGWLKAIAVALVAVWQALAALERQTDNNYHTWKNYEAIMSDSIKTVDDVSDSLENMDKQFEERIQRLKECGASEEELKKVTREYYEQQLKNVRAQAEENLAKRDAIKWYNILFKDTGKLRKEQEDLNAKANEYKKILQDTSRINPYENIKKDMEAILSSLSDEFTVKMAGGLATQGEYLQAQINVYKAERAKLFGRGRMPNAIKGDTEEERAANKKLATEWEAQIKGLEVQLAAYNADVAKKNRDAAQQLAVSIKEDYDELTETVKKELNSVKETWEKALGEFKASDILPQDEIGGRMTAQMMRYQREIESYIKKWQKLADEQKDSLGDYYNTFKNDLEAISNEWTNSLNAQFKDPMISEAVFNQGKAIQNEVESLKNDNEVMLNALSGGLISKEEYQKWLVGKMAEYNEILNREIETANPTEAAFIAASKAIIPPEVKAQMENDVKAYYDEIVKQIDKEFDKMSKEYSKKMRDFQAEVHKTTYGWMYGTYDDNSTLKSGENLMMKLLFGQGEDPKVTYDRARDQAQRMFDIIKEEADAEITLLQEKMSLLDQNSDQYQVYADKIENIQANLAAAQQELEENQLQNAQDYADRVYDIASSTMDALGGLASAMGSYYSEQKERAKEAYGENSAEYQKYVKKEGAMKIAQVWSDWAMGVMAAWAANAKYGVASYVLAALQTAALTATAVASTQQIKRQTQATASGGSTNANVSGITDRVVFGEAQNASQQAQLNAEYNQGATRVFVVATDMSEKQGENRTAVTNNTF